MYTIMVQFCRMLYLYVFKTLPRIIFKKKKKGFEPIMTLCIRLSIAKSLTINTSYRCIDFLV